MDDKQPPFEGCADHLLPIPLCATANNVVEKTGSLKTGKKQARPRKYTPSARRLRALIEVIGFEGRGAQTGFAKEIGVDRRRLNNVLVGYPLSRQLARIIICRYPGVSMDFLFMGTAGGLLDRKLERRLFDYQRRTGVLVFAS